MSYLFEAMEFDPMDEFVQCMSIDEHLYGMASVEEVEHIDPATILAIPDNEMEVGDGLVVAWNPAEGRELLEEDEERLEDQAVDHLVKELENYLAREDEELREEVKQFLLTRRGYRIDEHNTYSKILGRAMDATEKLFKHIDEKNCNAVELKKLRELFMPVFLAMRALKRLRKEEGGKLTEKKLSRQMYERELELGDYYSMEID